MDLSLALPTVFGIPQCDSVKRARLWLTQQGVAHEFHDFKKLGVSADDLNRWAAAVGWERLINRQGTTWRKLSAAEQAVLAQPGALAVAQVQAQPSVIKRPVIAWPSGQVTVGANEAVLTAAAAASSFTSPP
ncbi:MAG: ArsC/Spx/MgsR family protein [Pseudomonadota bacterium]